MAYETAAIAFFVIIIIVAIIVIILLIYYSCGTYYDDDSDNGDINDTLNDIQTNSYNRRQAFRTNAQVLASEVEYPAAVRRQRNKVNDTKIMNSLEEEILRLSKGVNNPIVGDSTYLNDLSDHDNLLENCGCHHEAISKTPTIVKKNCTKVDCQEVSDDISIRGKSVFNFMNEKCFPGIRKITKKEALPNGLENGKLIQFEGFVNYMIEMPSNPDEGLQLNFYNNSSCKQTLNSKLPFVSSNSNSLSKDIPIGSIICLISNGYEWISSYQNNSDSTSSSSTTTTPNSSERIIPTVVNDVVNDATTIAYNASVAVESKIPDISTQVETALVNIPVVNERRSRYQNRQTQLVSSLNTLDDQLKSMLDSGSL